MDSTNREEAPQATDRRTAVEQVLYGETDTRLRATWRILFAVAVFIGLVIIGETIFSAADVQPVITELKLPYLAALAGTVVVAVRLGGLIFQFAVTVIWARTGGLTVTDTAVRGVTTGASSLAIITGVSLFGLLVTAVWEEFVFRSLLIRNAAEGLAARSV